MGLTRHTTPLSETMQMPEKTDAVAEILGMLKQHWPILYGALLGGVIAVLRVIYDGGSLRQTVLEGLLCGALTLAVSAALEWLSMPATLTPFLGGFIGLIGVEGVRHLANGYLTKRVGRP